MFQNYLKIAWRNLRKHKIYSFINIIGLAVGIATSLLIFLVIRYEVSYDGYQSKKDRIFRVVNANTRRSTGEVDRYISSVPLPLPGVLRQELPEIEKVAGVWNIGGAQIHIP